MDSLATQAAASFRTMTSAFCAGMWVPQKTHARNQRNNTYTQPHPPHGAHGNALGPDVDWCPDKSECPDQTRDSAGQAEIPGEIRKVQHPKGAFVVASLDAHAAVEGLVAARHTTCWPALAPPLGDPRTRSQEHRALWAPSVWPVKLHDGHNLLSDITTSPGTSASPSTMTARRMHWNLSAVEHGRQLSDL